MAYYFKRLGLGAPPQPEGNTTLRAPGGAAPDGAGAGAARAPAGGGGTGFVSQMQKTEANAAGIEAMRNRLTAGLDTAAKGATAAAQEARDRGTVEAEEGNQRSFEDVAGEEIDAYHERQGELRRGVDALGTTGGARAAMNKTFGPGASRFDAAAARGALGDLGARYKDALGDGLAGAADAYRTRQGEVAEANRKREEERRRQDEERRRAGEREPQPWKGKNPNPGAAPDLPGDDTPLGAPAVPRSGHGNGYQPPGTPRTTLRRNR